MKILILTSIFVVAVIALPRAKRQVYYLPAGADLILSKTLQNTFSCEGKDGGYYADQGMDCQIFHVCHPTEKKTEQYSFICGNLTVFNQQTMTCSHPDDAVPCNKAHEFFHLNERLFDEEEVFLKDEEI
ncbi:U-scoloptoxin(01)-Cw1a-like [Centruroides vittatus]|uniref:uncharacterized protein LOC111632113 n=1 Tax=Centruroides sculpturatus TaxID=218467 RepID=UPI000C6D163B|nr:uncharacterized protein LOC111632113 [Centruroides sculpturatus]